jgi:hypothetical protein
VVARSRHGPDARSVIDVDGFGGYTRATRRVASQRGFWVNYGKGQPDEARFTRLLLDRGANPRRSRIAAPAPRKGAWRWAGARVPTRETARLGLLTVEIEAVEVLRDA